MTVLAIVVVVWFVAMIVMCRIPRVNAWLGAGTRWYDPVNFVFGGWFIAVIVLAVLVAAHGVAA